MDLICSMDHAKLVDNFIFDPINFLDAIASLDWGNESEWVSESVSQNP